MCQRKSILATLLAVLLAAICHQQAFATDEKSWLIEMRGQDLGYFTLDWSKFGLKWTTSLFCFVVHPDPWDATLYNDQNKKYTNMLFPDWNDKALAFGYGRKAEKQIRMSAWKKGESKIMTGVMATQYKRGWDNKKRGAAHEQISEEVWLSKEIAIPGKVWGPITSGYLQDMHLGFPLSYCETRLEKEQSHSWRPFTAISVTAKDYTAEDYKLPNGFTKVPSEIQVLAGTTAIGRFSELLDTKDDTKPQPATTPTRP